MFGAVANALLVVLGTVVGLFFKKGIKEKYSDTIIKGMGMVVMYLGVSGSLETVHTLRVIVAMAIGALIGELIDIDQKLTNLSLKVEERFAGGDKSGNFAKGFLTATMTFCVGGMAVYGAIQSGLQGDHSTQISKGIIDCVCAIIFTSTYGIGVGLSALSVLLYQGLLTVFATVIGPILTDIAIADLTGCGSMLLIGLGLNMTVGSKLKIMNYIPAIFLAAIFGLF